MFFSRKQQSFFSMRLNDIAGSGRMRLGCFLDLLFERQLSSFAKSVNTDYWLVVSNMNFIFHNIWDNPSH